jgi:hypothetical protein
VRFEQCLTIATASHCDSQIVHASLLLSRGIDPSMEELTMKKILLAATALGTLAGAHSVGAVSNGDLAFHYAPVHYQDTDSSDYPSEYITAFDYDSDRVSTNNWDNRGNGQWPATVHYSVVETCSHYFITYAFYHPRDWSDTIFDQEHENDLEGALMSSSTVST